MADEQHEWLDADAAEKLLRGEPVEPVDDHTRTELARLEAALRAVRTPDPSGGELPGEAAVMAAFREASGSRKRAGAARTATAAGTRDSLHTVRIGAASATPLRRPRWTRPVRFGLAVSLAGCALGGVAVAGGAGMLPAPFGGHGSPLPASSVSAAASPEEMGAEEPDAPRPSPPASGAPEVPSPPAASDEPDGADEGPAGGEASSTPGGDGTTGPEAGDRDGGTGRDGTTGPEAPGVPGGSAAEMLAKSVRACRDYRADALNKEQERRLLELADGERNLDRFCDRVLAADDRDGGSGGRTDESQDDGAGDGGNAGGPLPSISFLTRDAQDAQDAKDPKSAPQAGAGLRPAASPSSSPAASTRR
ncbi:MULTISPECIES: hypothetical protein [unclassified Streptomyces]|uniref:hypothetical protein n=1 Tax=unclassified Streptomyces TaxID=2593676 RepID=UPI0033BF8F46